MKSLNDCLFLKKRDANKKFHPRVFDEVQIINDRGIDSIVQFDNIYKKN